MRDTPKLQEKSKIDKALPVYNSIMREKTKSESTNKLTE
jgi:hypothetical protein